MAPWRSTLSMLLLAAIGACSASPDATTTTRPPDTTTTTTARPPTTTTEPPTTTTTLALPPVVPVSWEPCGGGLQCGRVEVPVDYERSGGETLSLALVRRPAGDPDRRIGSLLVNPGGPGASGVRRVARGFTVSPEVAARFDIVGFDPRGVGDSSPLSCGAAVPAFRATDLDPDTPAERDALAAAAQAVAEECERSDGARLPNLGTIDVARDVEVIRRALGEEQITFVGLSYGTLIGLLWAEAYPGSVRAMVLDGVVDPAASGGVASAEQVDAIDAAFRSADAACAGDPTCPLGDHGGLAAAYDELARRVEAGSVGGTAVGPTQLAYAAFYATYGAELWPRLWDAVARGLDGDPSGVSQMARSFTGLVEYAPFAVVTCLDAAHPVGFDAWAREADDLAVRSPRFGRIVSNELLPCAWWPQSRLEPHRVVATGTPPILVIGSTGDAATPYEQSVSVADDLAQGVLLTVELEGHIALGDSRCATDAASRYLVDLAPPPPGTRC